VTGKGMPKMKSLLQHLERAFDWAEAEKSGRIMPHEGVDDDFDAAATTITEVEKKLAAYLEQQRKHFNNSSEVSLLLFNTSVQHCNDSFCSFCGLLYLPY
jgi:hypothetical protein